MSDKKHIDTGGGAYVGGDVNTGGGKFVGRDDYSTTGASAAETLRSKKETRDTLPPVDVLLVTVTDVEARTVYGLVKQKFNREPQALYRGPKTYYDLGTIGGARTFMVRSEMGAGGPGGSMATVTEAISELSPSAVIMVGIAFGVDPEKQSLGDVLVSKQLVECDLQRVGTDRKGKVDIIPRGDRVTASPRLLDRFRDGELTWDVAKVWFGVMLSMQKLVDNVEVRDQLRKFEREAIGGEMEGAGLYAAAELKKVDWILAKAICDWADGNKSEDKKQRQQLAAQNAAGFVFHILERGGLAGGTPSSTARAPAGGGQVNQQATGSYIAQASGGGTATVNVTNVQLQLARAPTAQYRSKLRQNLSENFSDSELRDLCFDMQVDYESLPGEGKSAKARELIAYCERRGRLLELVTKCYELRPNIDWGDEYPSPAPTLSSLHQLPPPPHDFTGRDAELTEFASAIERGCIILGLYGMGGVGKTAFALKLAAQFAPRFPDAQFYFNLQGTSSTPRPATDIMARVIHSYDPQARIPEDKDELQAQYFSRLYNQRAILLLDNTANAEQARPLIPPVGCILLITSHEPIPLPGIFDRCLAALLPDEARKLLLTIEPRIGDHAVEIAKLCGDLALALRATGSLLKVTVALDPAVYAAQLRDERTRLKRIGKEGVDVDIEASFNLSYEGLLPETARVFRYLAIFPASFDEVLEEMVCEDPGHAHLNDLVRRSLVEYYPATTRYRLHNLLRLFAIQRLSLDEHEKLEINLMRCLADPIHRKERAILAGDCLIDLPWQPVKMRPTVLSTLRELMRDRYAPEAERRMAASQLTRLDWLTDAKDTSADELLNYLDLYGRFIDSATACRSVVSSITAILKDPRVKLPERQRGLLIARRAVMHGQLHELDEAEKDYRDSRDLINKLVGAGQGLPEDHKLAAQINLGIGNIIRLRAEQLDPQEQDQRKAGFQAAADLYLDAARSAKVYGQDVILEASVHTQLCYTYALLQDWPAAEKCYTETLKVLERGEEAVKHSRAYTTYKAGAMETASQMYWMRGQSLKPPNSLQALSDYETAYQLVKQEISLLTEPSIESYDLALAHINAGDYLSAMSECPNNQESQSLEKARDHWQTALEMARRLDILDLVQLASARLDRISQQPLGE